MNTKYTSFLLIIAVALLSVIAFTPHADQTPSFGAPESVLSNYAMNNTSSTCNAATSSIIVQPASSRQELVIANEGTSTMSVCFLNTTSTPCAAQTGIQIVPSTTYQMPATAPFFGPVACVMNAGGTSTVGLQYNQ